MSSEQLRQSSMESIEEFDEIAEKIATDINSTFENIVSNLKSETDYLLDAKSLNIQINNARELGYLVYVSFPEPEVVPEGYGSIFSVNSSGQNNGTNRMHNPLQGIQTPDGILNDSAWLIFSNDFQTPSRVRKMHYHSSEGYPIKNIRADQLPEDTMLIVSPIAKKHTN